MVVNSPCGISYWIDYFTVCLKIHLRSSLLSSLLRTPTPLGMSFRGTQNFRPKNNFSLRLITFFSSSYSVWRFNDRSYKAINCRSWEMSRPEFSKIFETLPASWIKTCLPSPFLHHLLPYFSLSFSFVSCFHLLPYFSHHFPSPLGSSVRNHIHIYSTCIYHIYHVFIYTIFIYWNSLFSWCYSLNLSTCKLSYAVKHGSSVWNIARS